MFFPGFHLGRLQSIWDRAGDPDAQHAVEMMMSQLSTIFNMRTVLKRAGLSVKSVLTSHLHHCTYPTLMIWHGRRTVVFPLGEQQLCTCSPAQHLYWTNSTTPQTHEPTTESWSSGQDIWRSLRTVMSTFWTKKTEGWTEKVNEPALIHLRNECSLLVERASFTLTVSSWTHVFILFCQTDLNQSAAGYLVRLLS